VAEELYREADFVERCFCDAPAPSTCACCHQFRCSEHLTDELCTRCTQAIERNLRSKNGRAWMIGGVSGVVTTIALLPLVSAAAIFVGLGVALGAGIGTRKIARAQAVRTLGRRIPLRGELPAEIRDSPPEPGSDSGPPAGGYG
jgi:hypothetical protein